MPLIEKVQESAWVARAMIAAGLLLYALRAATGDPSLSVLSPDLLLTALGVLCLVVASSLYSRIGRVGRFAVGVLFIGVIACMLIPAIRAVSRWLFS